MTSEEKLGFREWTAHYEKEQEADRDKINHIADIVGTLGGQVSKLSANMDTLIDNQKGMFNRLNRPWQWGVVVAGFMMMFSMAAMFGTMATLIITPIEKNLTHLQEMQASEEAKYLELHMWFRDKLEDGAVADAKQDTNIAWMMKMEERVNGRIHASALGVNP